MKRWVEFFEVSGVLSMRNLTVFITILVSSFIVLWLAFCATISGETRLNSELFIAYLLAGGGVYSFGKWQDAKTSRTEIECETDEDDSLRKKRGRRHAKD